jgi:hypothetical protein
MLHIPPRAFGAFVPVRHWTKSPDADFKRSIIYASTTNNFTTATEVGRTAGTRFVHSGLANSETWFYWITNEDRSGNESAKFPTSNTAGVTASSVLIASGGLGSGSVTTAKIAPLAVTSAEVAPLAILPSKRFPQDPTNYLNDPEMLELGNFSASGGGATLSQVINNTKGGSKYMLCATGVTAGTVTIATAIDIPVEDTEKYRVRCYMGQQITPVSPAYPFATYFGFGIYVDFYDTDASGNPNTLLGSQTICTPIFGFTPEEFGFYETEGNVSPIAGAQVARLRFTGLKKASLVDQVSTLYISSPSMRRKVRENEYEAKSIVGYDMVVDSTVDTALITDNAISELFSSVTNSSQGCAAGTTQTVEAVVVTSLAGDQYIEFTGELQNVSGGGRTMDVTLETASGTVLRTWPNVQLTDGGLQTFPWTEPPVGTSTTYRLRVKMMTAGSVNRTRLQAIVRRR